MSILDAGAGPLNAQKAIVCPIMLAAHDLARAQHARIKDRGRDPGDFEERVDRWVEFMLSPEKRGGHA